MIETPPYLQKDDIIGLVCPGGYMASEKVQACVNTLQQWGYRVKIGSTVGSASENYFSGTREERLNDFQQMLDDDEIKAILCARGGYGTTHIIDDLNFKKFREQPKWIIGFSDITVLHCHLYANFYISSLHAPMAAAFNDDESINEYLESLKKALNGRKIKYQAAPFEFNKKGEGIGELVGGNLALLSHIAGSDSDTKTKGRILFLEDTGEYLYNIDRMMYQLKRSGKLSKLAGLIIGGFTDCKDTERPFGKNVYEIIHDIVKEYDYPVCYGFPVGHQKENYALKIGVGYKLKVARNKVTLEE
jgi:muramoyltetrapeptide carboxypeptidase